MLIRCSVQASFITIKGQLQSLNVQVMYVAHSLYIKIIFAVNYDCGNISLEEFNESMFNPGGSIIVRSTLLLKLANGMFRK